MTAALNEKRFPIGKFIYPENVTIADIVGYINDIESLPGKLSDLCLGLPDEAYGYKYRKGSWNVRQLLFHISDSHSHSYIRFKWTLTEKNPLIKVYAEQDWAILEDGLNAPICEILEEIKIIQRRLGRVIRSLSESDIQRTFIHPEYNRSISLGQLAALYAWHGNHHLNHLILAINDPVEDYVPIDCNFYDVLVLHAMKQTQLTVQDPIEGESHNIIKDIYTRDKNEFLMMGDGTTISLDRLVNLKDGVLILR